MHDYLADMLPFQAENKALALKGFGRLSLMLPLPSGP